MGREARCGARGDARHHHRRCAARCPRAQLSGGPGGGRRRARPRLARHLDRGLSGARSEEHTSELQSLMRISYAVFCLKKKKNNRNIIEEQDIDARYIKIVTEGLRK